MVVIQKKRREKKKYDRIILGYINIPPLLTIRDTLHSIASGALRRD